MLLWADRPLSCLQVLQLASPLKEAYDMEQLPQSIGVVWVDARYALVATAPDGEATLTRVNRNTDSEPAYLLRVARAAADCDRLFVMGPDEAKLSFEREYVALYRRPDRVSDVPAAAMPDADQLLARLQRLDAPAA